MIKNRGKKNITQKTHSPITLHIALATIPRKQAKEYPEKIKEKFYDAYVEKTLDFYSIKKSYYKKKNEKERLLYNPLKYYIFGNYDIAFISLVDSYKFAQKLFSPKETPKGENDPSKLLNPHAFQILSGILLNSKKECETIFEKAFIAKQKRQSNFLAICNLKLNNAFLIGNGFDFFNEVVDIIKEKVYQVFNQKTGNNNFLTLQSFSWFDISLVLLIDEVSIVSKLLNVLRDLKIGDLPNSVKVVIASNSLYTNDKTIYDSHIFADTQTYFGINCELYNKPKLKLSAKQKQGVVLETEWQVKPGHYDDLLYELKSHNIQFLKKNKIDKSYLLTGKSDFLLSDRSANLERHFTLINTLLTKENNFHRYVKKIKTNVLFPLRPKLIQDKSSATKKQSSTIQAKLRENLKLIAIPPDVIQIISDKLKALKVSRQIRAKILKVFYNYNNGIQDSILFIYFIDFTVFVYELKALIEEIHNNWKEVFINQKHETINDYDLEVDSLEKLLLERILIFNEAFNLRTLNCYQFEDINDFDLDFNSSIQQLLTTYNMFIASIANAFSKDNFNNVPIVRLSMKNTKANYHSINYNVYHLLSPEFVFFTAAKEVQNYYMLGAKDIGLRDNLQIFKKSIDDAFKKIPDLSSLYKDDSFDIDYFYIDAVRFYYTCNLDFDLFSYWFWTYNFQNAALYDKSGIMDEKNFTNELIRLIFLGKFYGFVVKQDDCPIPELKNYWERHYTKIENGLSIFFANNLTIVKYFKQFILDTTIRTLQDNLLEIKNGPPKIEKERKFIGSKNYLKNYFSCADSSQNLFDNNFLLHTSGVLGTKFSDFEHRSIYLHTFYESHKNKIIQGTPLLYNETEFHTQELFINGVMFTYLKVIKDLNGDKIRFLNRDWETGEPLSMFLNFDITEEMLYKVDQTGGIFFNSPQKLNKYFIMRNGVLQTLWNFSLVVKKQFINHLFSPNK